MNTETIITLTFIICFSLGVLLVSGIDTLIKRKKAHNRYIRRLEIENAHLNRTIAVLRVALESKGGK